MTKKNFQKWIKANDACADGKNFAKNKTLEQVWNTCDRPDWMLWIYVRSKSPNNNICAQIAIYCAGLVLHIYENKYPNDDRPCKAIQAAKDYLNNPSNAADAADAAARAADAAAYAAYAAAYAAARSAACAANAAYAAADAAYAAADAAYAAARSAACAANAAYAAADAAADAAARAANAAAYAAYAAADAEKNINKQVCDYIRSLIVLPEL